MHPKAEKKDKNQIGAPMPGTVVEVRVKEGDKVEKGTALVVLSAMKMEMIVQAPLTGTIKKIHVDKGLKLEGEDLVITME